MSWNDFNAADTQQEFTPIPSGTLARVRLTIKPGGYNDPAQGWTDGMATHNAQKGTVYLSCEFVVLEGQYARRKIWTNIGLYSPSGPNWANMGRSMIKGILNSARGISNKDNSPQAQKARCIHSLANLDGIEFLAKISLEKNRDGETKNAINYAVTPDHKDYASLMGGIAASPAQPTAAAPKTNLPSWAQ